MAEGLKSADNPLVSVTIIFFDGEAFLAEAIESVIAQTYRNWELFLVDDGSGPAATAIAQQYAAMYPDRIYYLDHPDHANRGSSAARNLGIRHARGELLAFLDGDDVWLPDKLAQQVPLLDAHPEVGMVCGTTIYWRSWSNGLDDVVPTGHRRDVVIYPPDAALELFPLGTTPPVSMSDFVLRATLMKRLGGFEEKFIGHYESQVFQSKVLLFAPVYFSSAATNKYRQHPASCLQTAIREGKAPQNRLRFLEWLEQYLKSIDNVDERVVSSLRRELRPYRNPRIHYFISILAKVRNKFRRLLARAGRFIPRKAT